jgi:integrase/recombinase XerD
MVEQFFRRQHVQHRIKCNLLASLLAEFVNHLAERSYSSSSIQAYVQAAEHFGHWMQSNGRLATDICSEMVEGFLGHLEHCNCPPPRSHTVHVVRAALHRFLDCVPISAERMASSPDTTSIEGVVFAFDAHMCDACGFAATTRDAYQRYARWFLEDRYGAALVDLAALTLTDVRAFVTSRAASLTPGSTNALINGIRCFLRYLRLQGFGDPRWPQAISRAAYWRLAGLPQILTDDQLERFLSAFDRTTALGRRDYAVARSFTELGLRACEVAQLCLDDIDWRGKTVTIAPAKLRRAMQLPLPERLAAALADYLCNGRPTTSSRRIFVQHRAPLGEPLSPAGVRSAICYGYQRAGLERRGPHILRRTAATRLLRAGASTKEIADFLRHRSLDTSAIYAKVDVAALGAVALTWPEVRQ